MKMRKVLLRVLLIWIGLTALLSPYQQASGKTGQVTSSLGAGETAAAFFTPLSQLKTASVDAWLDASWGYRRAVTITNPCGQAQTDYQARIELTSAFDFSHARSDGADIRVTTSDGQTQIPFWIESWLPPSSAVIWVKAPSIATDGTMLYLYYGNDNPPAVPQVETPPIGPWTRPDNTITPIGDPGSGDDLLADGMVYDSQTGHYWMVFANYRDGSIGLAYSDDPGNPTAWTWHGSIMTSANAPFLLQDEDTWYLFYADRGHGGPPYPISLATSDAVDGTYTYQGIVLNPGASGSWEDYRVDAPFVFWHTGISKWVIVYMGDAGGSVTQVGYATADDIIGPYTKYTHNPILGFGASGMYDAGTVSDPWVYEFQGVYFIGYAASPTTSSPWQTAYAVTTDWTTFTKQGMTLPVGVPGAFDDANAFRGMAARFGATYYLPYTASATSGAYRMAVATQPVQVGINNAGLVFEFHDFFDGDNLSTRWNYYLNGTGHTITVSAGTLNITTVVGGTSGLVQLWGSPLLGTGVLLEAYARHQDAGVDPGDETNTALELGYKRSLTSFIDNHLRIMDFPDLTQFVIEATAAGSSSGVETTAVEFDTGWHTYLISRTLSGGQAGFQVDDHAVEYLGSPYVPTLKMQPWLASYARTPATQSRISVDWVRVRKWCGVEMIAAVGAEQPAVDLSLSKTDSPDPVYYNSPLTYTLTISNLGFDTATAVVVTDTLPANVTFVSATPSQGEDCTSSETQVLCYLGSLESFAQATVEIVVTPHRLGSLVNTALVSTTYPERMLENNSTSASTQVIPGVDLSISISDSPDPVYIGDLVTYTLTILNSGPRLADGVVVTDTLPVGVMFYSIVPSQGNCTETLPLVCSLGLIPSGGSATIDVSATVEQLGMLTNTAEVATPLPESSLANNIDSEDTTVLPVADLMLTKTGSVDATPAGSYITYTLAVMNLGPNPAEAVGVVDTLPEQVQLIAVSPAGNCTLADPVVCQFALLGVGESLTVTILAQTTIDGVAVNTAQVDSTTQDVETGNNSDQHVLFISQTVDLSVAMAETMPVVAGEALTYTITVNNAGPSLASAVRLTDTLPADAYLIDIAPLSGDWDCLDLVCTLATLPVGMEASLALVAGVNANAGDVLTNTVAVGSAEPDSHHFDNTFYETTPVIRNADLAVALTTSPQSAIAGSALVYTMTVTNFGPSEVDGVEVDVALPAGVTPQAVDPGCSANDGHVVCELDRLAAQGWGQAGFTGLVDAGATGVLASQASVSSPFEDPNSTNNQTVLYTLVERQSDLEIDSFGSPLWARPGGVVTYTLTVVNHGPSDVFSVVVTDSLPGEVTFLSPSACTEIPASNDVLCSLATIAAGDAGQVAVVGLVSGSASGSLTNQAMVSSEGDDPQPGNNDTEATVPVDAQPPYGWWEQPAGDEQRFDVEGEVITLTAGVTDNIGIAEVCFIWWDPVDIEYKDIGCDQSAPYTLPFDTHILYPGWNQVFIKVYDLAGNIYERSAPLSRYPRILLFLITDLEIYLPVILR